MFTNRIETFVGVQRLTRGVDTSRDVLDAASRRCLKHDGAKMSLASAIQSGEGSWDTGKGAHKGGTGKMKRRGGNTRDAAARVGVTRTAGSSKSLGNRVAPEEGRIDDDLVRGKAKRRMEITGSVRGGDRLRATKKDSGLSAGARSRFRYRSSRWMVDPRDPFMRYWDTCSITFLVFAAIVTPYEVAFLDVGMFAPLWWINRVIDVFFFFDLVLNFNLIYWDEKSHGFVTDRSQVIRR